MVIKFYWLQPVRDGIKKGKEAQLLHAGDTIVTHAGVKHWHGATKDSWFSHVAITAGEAVWLEEVSDEQYENL